MLQPYYQQEVEGNKVLKRVKEADTNYKIFGKFNYNHFGILHSR